MKVNSNSEETLDCLKRQVRQSIEEKYHEVESIWNDVVEMGRPIWQLHYHVNELNKLLYIATNQDEEKP